MSEKPHILVVDDDLEICDIVREYLAGGGYRVSVAHDSGAMRRVFEHFAIDVVLLDLVLPQEDGLALARTLRREYPEIGIIILSGRGEVIDRIVGLEIGADDYLAKPFHLRELLARIKSVTRRPESARADPAQAHPTQFRFAGWRLDMAARELSGPDGKSVQLTGGEFDLLAAFVSRPNQMLSRERLLDITRSRGPGLFDRTVDVQVGRLRRKLDEDPKQPRVIKTVRGGGYMFVPAVETVSESGPVLSADAPLG